ncbi:hypothetical protein GCM10027589_46590 [Actinocorallia lasiicapitis]
MADPVDPPDESPDSFALPQATAPNARATDAPAATATFPIFETPTTPPRTATSPIQPIIDRIPPKTTHPPAPTTPRPPHGQSLTEPDARAPPGEIAGNAPDGLLGTDRGKA